MHRPKTSCLLLLSACGAQISDNLGQVDGPDAAIARDAASVDAATPDALPLGPWLAATKVAVAATTAIEDDVTLSSNALEMVFAVLVPATATTAATKDLYYTSRTSLAADWAQPAKLPFVSATFSEEAPRFSGDNKTLYFASDPITAGNLDIYMVSHPAPGNTWGTPQPIVGNGINTAVTEKWFAPCGADRYVVVRSVTGNGTDLFEGTLSGGAPVAIANLNTTYTETGAFLTQDCLTIYFASTRFTPDPEKIMVSHRATATSPWPPAVPVEDFKATGGNQEDPWLSSDGRTFVFASDIAGAGNKDVYLSTR